MARHTELTPELQDEALKLAAAGIPKRVIADIIGVGRSTFFYWIQIGQDDYTPTPGGRKPPADLTPYQEFADAFVRVRGKVIAQLIAQWLKEARMDAAQAAHWLKVNEPELFKDQAHLRLQFGDQQAAMDAWKQSIVDMTKPRQIEPDGGE
jgi:predicted XRE-type DNA-binding protein